MNKIRFIVILTLIHTSKQEDDSKLWRIQMNIPKMLMNIAEITGLVDKSAVRTLTSEVKHNTMTIEVKPPDFGQILSVLSKGKAERAGSSEESERPPEKKHISASKGRMKSKANLRKRDSERGRDHRRAAPEFYVEVGPGAFKSEQISYPPDYFRNQLMKLIRLKEKRDMNRQIKYQNAESENEEATESGNEVAEKGKE